MPLLVSPLCEREWGRTGAVLIVLYAVVVPILKLVLLAVAEVFRCSAEPKFKVALTPLRGVNDSLPTPKINSLPTPSHSQHQELTPNKNQLTSNTKSTFRRRGRVDFPVSPLVLRRHFWNPIIYKHYTENDQH